MNEVVKVLKKVVSKSGGAKKWADSYGVPVNLVLDVLAGRKEPGPIILNALGLDSFSEPEYQEQEEKREIRQKTIRIKLPKVVDDEEENYY